MESVQVGQLCWVGRTGKDSSWDEGMVTAITEKDVTLNLTSERALAIPTKVVVPRSFIYPKNDERQSLLPDLTSMTYLSRATVVHALLQRYAQGSIYTHSGAVLIALNPYAAIKGLYDAEMMQKVHSGLGAAEPHVYNTVERAYRALIRSGTPQSILVSGESGAGKTETTKHVLSYLSFISTSSSAGSVPSSAGSVPSSVGIKERVLASTPLLEALGNARTVYNDNSSRFGKFISVQFDERGSMLGANIQTYLLERSRIVKPKPGERSFHIFYQVVKGLSVAQRAKYGIMDVPARYRYLQGSDVEPRDEEDYRSTLSALSRLGFTAEEQDAFHYALSVVLSLGNVEFRDEGKEVTVADQRWLMLVAKFLGCEPDVLRQALTQRTMSVTKSMNSTAPLGSLYIIRSDRVACERSRDSLAMLVYSRLLAWVVRRVNDILRPSTTPDAPTPPPTPPSALFIGILDIYGFESFGVNGFEQLCINYANEKLQRQFNHQIFKRELDQYREEGIDCTNIDYQDNSSVINAIEGTSSVPGIAQYLDDQSKVASGGGSGGSDGAFVRSLLASGVDKTVVRKPDANAPGDVFAIQHYADRVTYTATGFVDRNTDYVIEEHLSVLRRRECVLSCMFPEEEEAAPGSVTKVQRSGSASGKGGTFRRGLSNHGAAGSGGSGVSMVLTTVFTRFRASLDELLALIATTETHYVRCIKPNLQKRPSIVDRDLVVRQLGCGGVFETVRVMMAGFPTRMTVETLIRQYGCTSMRSVPVRTIASTTATQPSPLEIAERVLRDATDGSKDGRTLYRVGRTKVFMAAGVGARLERYRLRFERALVTVQRRWRCIQQRRRYLALLGKVHVLRSASRCKATRLAYRKVREHAIQTSSARKGGASRVVAADAIPAQAAPTLQAQLLSPVPSQLPPTLALDSTTTPRETPRDTPRDKAGWQSGLMSEVVHERSVAYEGEIASLRGELSKLREREKATREVVSRLERVLGTPLAGFDTVRAEMERHYETRLKVLERQLEEERQMRQCDVDLSEGMKQILGRRSEALIKDVEDLRKKAEKSKSEHRERKALERRVEELERDLKEARKGTGSGSGNSVGGGGSVATQAAWTAELDRRLSEQRAHLDRILSTVQKLGESGEDAKALSRTLQTRHAELVEVLGSLQEDAMKKGDYAQLMKGILDWFHAHDMQMTGKLKALEETVRPETLSAAISVAMGGMVAKLVPLLTPERDAQAVAAQTSSLAHLEQLQSVAEEVGAPEPTGSSILRALRQHSASKDAAEARSRDAVIRTYEGRMAALNRENAEMARKVEELLQALSRSA
jgi:myosin heavy subunit